MEDKEDKIVNNIIQDNFPKFKEEKLPNRKDLPNAQKSN